MAARKSIANSKISSPTARAKLPISGKPVYIKLTTGISLGYRRNASDGVWVVRISDGQGGNKVTRLAFADDHVPADDGNVLSFPQAQSRALGARSTIAQPRAQTITVAAALDEYEANLEKRGGDTRILTRIRVIMAPLLDSKLTELTSGTLQRWQDGLPGVAATINRQCASILAAFRFAASRHDLPEPYPWAKGLPLVKRLGEAKRDRNVVLTDDVVRRLVSEAYNRSFEFGLLVDLSAVTGVRYSQLTRCQVQHLQGSRLTVHPSRKGKADKSAVAQTLEIGAGLADRLRVAAAGRPMTAPLLTKPSGEPWRQSDHFIRFRGAVTAIGEDPDQVSLYALRHTHITAQILANKPIRQVAAWHDTSVGEIETTYSRHINAHVEPPPAVDYGPLPDSEKVVRLRG